MQHLFLADENVPQLSVRTLRKNGFDVSWVSEIAASISDIEVCTLAQAENRIIITSDKDFGDLVMRDKIKVPGVILLRVNGLLSKEISDLLLQALNQGHNLLGQFIVITKDSIRLRQLP